MDNGVSYRLVEAYLFGTCNLKCGYCWFAESGKVLDSSELARFRDLNVIRQVTDFFNKRTSASEKWHLLVTGGEPLLMPNFQVFAQRLFEAGNKISCYTALLIDQKHPSFQCLLRHSNKDFGYIMASFHPEAELQEDAYFERVDMLKAAGHNVIVRFVGHPKRLHLLERLSEKCKAHGVCFYPTTLFSNNYPAAYTAEERSQLSRYFSSLSQVIQLEGGLDTNYTLCFAGSRLLSVDFTTGAIWPCISVQSPVLGNIYEDTFDPLPAPTRCPKMGMACYCDIHFQQNVVIGADDSILFERVKAGFAEPLPMPEQQRRVENRKLKFTSVRKEIGNVEDDQTLIYSKASVKERFEKNFASKGLINIESPAAPDKPLEPKKSLPETIEMEHAKLPSLLGH